MSSPKELRSASSTALQHMASRRDEISVAALAILVFFVCSSLPAFAQAPQIRLVRGPNVVDIQAYAPNIVDIHFEPAGKVTPRTLVMDPSLKPSDVKTVRVGSNGSVQTLTSPQMKVLASDTPQFAIQVQNAQGQTLVTIKQGSPLGASSGRSRGPRPFQTEIIHNESENLYGISGLPRRNNDAGILRNGGGAVSASYQGNGGAPFFFTKRYGVLVDSDGGSFLTIDNAIGLMNGSRPDTEYFVIVGPPVKVMSGLSLLTGRPPMPPKWSLGFLNSQWGSNEQEWKQITNMYEKAGIPVSAYIMDFDWKAWGESNYGEFRWNSTPGPGMVQPVKFPDGASGKFANEMLTHGIHLVGIMKPRLIMYLPDGKMTTQAKYATEHHFWYPHEAPYTGYFSHRLARDVNFADPAARKWFWDHMEHAFHTGIAGWWNDEADQIAGTAFNNFQFMNMARAEYEGQRSISNQRVWTINRNYYLGADRYAYAEWSGDIMTGFQTMAYQRRRMISTLDLGESWWSMDTGGFIGHPTPENYARWMEFAAFVPIYRVHGTYEQKRQPWVYGPTAEAAAKKAILLRYDLLPYIYSYTRVDNQTGIGLVRPLFWEFPNDPKCSTEANAWMFGDALLVSPIVKEGLQSHTFYMPPGMWFNYFSGKPVEGGREISVPINSKTWQDIPLYVRAGSIVATRPDPHWNQLNPSTPLVLGVFPSRARAARFMVYDDDGLTYDYEKGFYFQQQITAKRAPRATDIEINSATGSYKPHFSVYLLQVHQPSNSVKLDGRSLRKAASAAAFQSATSAVWFSTTDRFGPVTEIRLTVDGKQHNLRLALR